MAVKIVTDSACDISPELAKRFGITVLPYRIYFGNQAYLDGIDLTSEELYRRLKESEKPPTTSAPTPGELSQAYRELANETDEIVSIHVSSKLSAVYNSALRMSEELKGACKIRVIDSFQGSISQGLLVIAAAKAAIAGKNLDEVCDVVTKSMSRIHLRFLLETLEYLRRGGRITKAKSVLGALIRIHPVLGIKDGEVYPFGQPRTYSKAFDFLYEFAKGFSQIEEIAIGHTDNFDEAERLTEQVRPLCPGKEVYRTSIGCVVGTHVGPSLWIAILGE